MFNFSFVWQSNVALHRSITIFCWERCDQSPCPKEQNKKTKNKNKLENTLSKPNSITAQECGAVESNWRQNLIFRRLFFLHYTTLFTTCCNACYSFHSELISTGQQKRRAQENSKQRTQHGQQQQRGPVSHLRCVWKKNYTSCPTVKSGCHFFRGYLARDMYSKPSSCQQNDGNN